MISVKREWNFFFGGSSKQNIIKRPKLAFSKNKSVSMFFGYDKGGSFTIYNFPLMQIQKINHAKKEVFS